MIYFDYTANTPASNNALNAFVTAEKTYIGNPNSNHQAGLCARECIEKSTEQIASLLSIQSDEIIYTSGATEANNLAIKGLAEANVHTGKHIISTALEHTSVSASLSYLQERGWEIDLCPIDRNGMIDLEELEDLLRKDTALVSISSVDSELGIRQPVEKVRDLVRQYPECRLHIDATQAVGKIPVDFSIGDTISFTAHKFYGLNGIGALIKKKGIALTPQISGGKSTTIYRSGTPTTGLIASLSASLEEALSNESERYQKVQSLNQILRDELKKIPGIEINSPINAIPHILNIGIHGISGPRMQKLIDEKGISVSVKSACSSDALPSRAVMALTRNKKRAHESFRISLSHLTKDDEIKALIQAIQEITEEREMI